jgi:hypothetical protein
LKKADLRKGKVTRSARDKWRVVVAENPWEVIFLLATCRKGKHGGDDGGERRQRGLGCVSFSLYFLDSFFQNEIS